MMEPPVKDPPEMGLIGHSSVLARVKREIVKVADLNSPVLISGESGTGKELAARAIHKMGARSKRPFFSINMGAIPPSLAASELFGAKRGSYSGADQSRGEPATFGSPSGRYTKHRMSAPSKVVGRTHTPRPAKRMSSFGTSKGPAADSASARRSRTAPLGASV